VVGVAEEYRDKEREERADHHIPPGDEILFLEVTVPDSSECMHLGRRGTGSAQRDSAVRRHCAWFGYRFCGLWGQNSACRTSVKMPMGFGHLPPAQSPLTLVVSMCVPSRVP
jgi:hypothetical protein